MTLSPLFKLGEKRLADLAAKPDRAPNVLSFTRDKATRKRERARLREYRRHGLAIALLNWGNA